MIGLSHKAIYIAIARNLREFGYSGCERQHGRGGSRSDALRRPIAARRCRNVR
jgi:hypothetical protein